MAIKATLKVKNRSQICNINRHRPREMDTNIPNIKRIKYNMY